MISVLETRTERITSDTDDLNPKPKRRHGIRFPAPRGHRPRSRRERPIDPRPNLDLEGLSPSEEDACRPHAEESDGVVFDAEEGAFTDADDGDGVLFVELPDALLARLAFEGRGRIGVEVVAVELEVEEAEGVE